MFTHFNQQRRRIFQALTVLPLFGTSKLYANQRMATPQQTAGPYYPSFPVPDADANLLQHSSGSAIAGGEPLNLNGEVLDLQGKPVAGATVEIWQCDVTGHYHHSTDRAGEARDEHFQGYGAVQTDAMGRYQFRTIVPVAYPGRTPHIHVAVTAAGHAKLTTQLYIAGEPTNNQDFLYRSLSKAEQLAVTIQLQAESDLLTQRGFFSIVFK